MRGRGRKGQVTVEACLIWLFACTAFVFIAIYVQRAVQGGVKSNADSIGTQYSTETLWSSYTASKTYEDTGQQSQQSCTNVSHGLGAGGGTAGACAP